MFISVLTSLALKFAQAILSFAIVKRLVGSWGQADYGVWVTMASVIAYMSMFDFGVGYGVRNRIAEAQGSDSAASAAEYTAAGFMIYLALALVIGVAGLAAIPFVDPFRLHPVPAAILWLCCVAAFVASFGNIVLQGYGKFKILNALALIVPAGWIALIYTPVAPTANSASAAALYGGLLVAQSAVALALAWRLNRFRLVFDRTHVLIVRGLVNTGLKFFVLQIASLTLFYSGNLLLYHHLGPNDVARYDAASKVFSMFTVAFSILVSIAWTEVSKAKARGDRRTLQRIHWGMNMASVIVFAFAVGVAEFADVVFPRLTSIPVATPDAMWFAVLVGVQSLAFSSALYLNAYERLNGQVVLALLSIPMFFIAATTLIDRDFGVSSVPLATLLSILPAMLFCFVSTLKITSKSATP